MGAPAGSLGGPRLILAGLRGRRHRLLAVVALTVGGVAAGVPGPMLLGAATDIVVRSTQPGRSLDDTALGRTLALVVALQAVKAVCTWAQGRLIVDVAQQLAHDLRVRMVDKVARLPLTVVESSRRGDLLSRMTSDVDNVATTLKDAFTRLVAAAVTVAGALAMMLVISPLLTLVALTPVPLLAVCVRRLTERSRPYFTSQWRRTGDLGGLIEETFSGHLVVAGYDRQETVTRTFDALNEELYRASRRAQLVAGVVRPVTAVLDNLGYVAVAVVGALRVAAGQLSVGDVQAVVHYAGGLTGPVGDITRTAGLIHSCLASAGRVAEFLDAPEEAADPPSAATAPTPPNGAARDRGTTGAPSGSLRLAAVSFRYAEDAPLIEELDLDVPPGRTVAIVGPNGAGKTTLVDLLLRFHDPRAGAITVDGTDLRRLARDDLRRRFGVVPQEGWLFAGTIRENIAYGRPGATDAEVVRAARSAHADAFVRSLPHGYATSLEEAGANLAAGERQLLAIARAVLIDPEILVMDEATSSVDCRTDLLIRRATTALRRGRTSFIVAHRLATVRDADDILVMEHGRIVERGRHEDLLHRRGAYFQIVHGAAAPGLTEQGPRAGAR